MVAQPLAVCMNSVLRSRLFWFAFSTGVSGYLTFAPLFQPHWWNAKRQLQGFGALAVTLSIAAWSGRSLEDFVTELSVTRRMRHQYEIDDIVHAVNYKRAVNGKEIRLINGAQTMGELQEMMVEQMQIMAETMKALRGGHIGQGQLPAASDEPLPTVDVAELIASTLLDPENGGSVLIAAPRRTGKSNLQRATMHHVHYKTSGQVDFVAFAGKKGEKFCGLERSSQDYMFSGSPDKAEEVADRFDVYAALCERPNGSGLPTVILSDEHNHTLGAAAMVKAKQGEVKLVDRIAGATYRIVTQGPSKLVNAILTSHSGLVQDIRLNSQVQQSVKTLVLGSPYNWEALEFVLQGEAKLIRSGKVKEGLGQQFEAYRADRKGFLCLHNLRGNWELNVMPQYPDHPGDLDFGAADLSTEDLLDEETLIEYFSQPDSPPSQEDLERMLKHDADPRFIDPSEWTDDQINEFIDRNRNNSKSNLSKPAQAILDKYIQKEMYGTWIDAKWVRNFVFYTKELKQFSSSQIRGFLRELVQSGRGRVEGEGDMIMWLMETSEP